MIEFGDKIKFPSEWHELSETQFLKVIEVLSFAYSQETDIFQLQLMLLPILSGYKRSKKRYKKADRELIDNGVVFLAEQIRFPFKFYYTDDAYYKLEPGLKKKLRKYLPSEIYDKDLPKNLNPQFQLDLFWKKNPFPFFRFDGKLYNGPVINIDKYGILHTSLIAEQYADAVAYYDSFLKTKDEKFLNHILASLYIPDVYDSQSVPENALLFEKVHYSIKLTAFYLIQNLLEFLCDFSAYKILFSRGKTNSEKISLGVEGTILDLSKSGVGTEKELSKTNLVKLLNMQVDKLQSLVAECRAHDMKAHEISTKLGIPISTLAKL